MASYSLPICGQNTRFYNYLCRHYSGGKDCIMATIIRCERLNSAVRFFLSIIGYFSFGRLSKDLHNRIEDIAREAQNE